MLSSFCKLPFRIFVWCFVFQNFPSFAYGDGAALTEEEKGRVLAHNRVELGRLKAEWEGLRRELTEVEKRENGAGDSGWEVDGSAEYMSRILESIGVSQGKLEEGP